MNRALAIAGLLVLAEIPASFANTKQAAQNQAAISANLKGTIRDGSGNPISDAGVSLEEKGSAKIVRARSGAKGAYAFTVERAGSYTVRAEKTGWVATVVDSVALVTGETKQVDLVLRPANSIQIKKEAEPTGKKAAAEGMELKDEPSFQVAGVTDWSDLGLHGSARSSKTSETLAKETRELKAEGGVARSDGTNGRYAGALENKTKGKFAEAREEVRERLKARDDAEGHRLLGELDETLGDPLAAVNEYEKAAEMEPSEENYFEWGTELLLHKAAKPAAEVFRRGAKEHPQSARMLTGLGAALYASGSEEEAARQLCRAAEMQPENETAYLFLGKMEAATSEELPCSEEKLGEFAKMRATSAEANYYYAISVEKRAKAASNASGVKEAEELFEKAVALDPKFGEAELQLGLLRAANGEGEEALRDFQRAIGASPKLAEAHRQLGLAYQRNGEKAKAQAEFAEYEGLTKAKAAETEREQREMRQFVILLKGQQETAPSHPH